MGNASLSQSEIESIRFHLGYGNVGIGAWPYSGDGYVELFNQVVGQYLGTAEDASSSTAVAAAGTQAITLSSAAGLGVAARVLVDVGDAMEIVVLKAVAGLSVTATFTKAHVGPYPVLAMSGVARVRQLLHSIDTAFSTLQSPTITKTAGLKQLGQGQIEWQQGGAVLAQTKDHYTELCNQLSSLVRVPRLHTAGGGATSYEPY